MIQKTKPGVGRESGEEGTLYSKRSEETEAEWREGGRGPCQCHGYPRNKTSAKALRHEDIYSVPGSARKVCDWYRVREEKYSWKLCVREAGVFAFLVIRAGLWHWPICG